MQTLVCVTLQYYCAYNLKNIFFSGQLRPIASTLQDEAECLQTQGRPLDLSQDVRERLTKDMVEKDGTVGWPAKQHDSIEVSTTLAALKKAREKQTS